MRHPVAIVDSRKMMRGLRTSRVHMHNYGSVSKVVFLAALLVVAILRAMVTEERWQELVDALQEIRQQVVLLETQKLFLLMEEIYLLKN